MSDTEFNAFTACHTRMTLGIVIHCQTTYDHSAFAESGRNDWRNQAQMKVLILILALGFVILGTLILPTSTTTLAQQGVQTAPTARGGVGRQPAPKPGQFKSVGRRGGTPTFAGPPEGTQPLP